MQNMEFGKESNPFYLSFIKQDGTIDMPKNHFHDRYEVYYLFSGERHYFIKDRTYHVEKGSLVFINIHELHRTIHGGAACCERFLINFSPSFLIRDEKMKNTALLEPFRNGGCVVNLGPRDRVFVEELIARMCNEAGNRGPGFEELLLSYLIQLLAFSARMVMQQSAPEHPFPNPALERIDPIVKYINSHFTEPLTLLSVSRRFYLSSYHFCRFFKQCTGFTFIEYLNNIRVIEAQRLLRNNSGSLTEISEKTGFGSISHFGRSFKKATGVSPLQYRKSFAE